MAADVLSIDSATNNLFSLDVYKANAYAEDVKFDLRPPKQYRSPRGVIDIEPVQEIRVNPDVSLDTNPSREWDTDVKSLISTRKWLQNYGLRKNRLDMYQILPQIGFKHADDYDKVIKKPICSRYGTSMFQRYFRSDGQIFNVACSKDQLRQVEARLTRAICLYKRRLEWLTTESRRIFGVMEEKSIAIIVDIKNLSPQQFDQYKAALQRVIKEQVAQIAKFNLIRASEDLVSYHQHCVPVTGESIDGALQWIEKLDRCAAVSPTATCEAIMKALTDRNLEAIYLFTEGSACDGARELLKEKLTGSRLPVHVVSYNCTDPDTIHFLKDMARITGGRFHAYAVTMEMDSYEGLPVDGDTNHANIILKKKTYGGVPPGVGMREDVILLFEELEEARNNLAQIQGLITDMPDKSVGGVFRRSWNTLSFSRDKSGAEIEENISETYMSSREWLDRHGLKAKRLGFYDILAGVAFKHQDGVVDLKMPPGDEQFQTDAVTKQKLVNAKYCDKFPHVRWKDGQVVHVQVTPEVHRAYEQRMMLTMEAIQQRIDWLQQGSRELFGTVIEDQIYILVDTSASMAPHIQFVKDKLFVLMQEQLRHKQKFNLVAFNSRAHCWKDHLVEVNEKNLQSAWSWIKALVCLGSTNTLAALRHALSDPSTQAIYVLTDGRPDQPPKSILAQVMLHPQVPVHTISFNCADKEANEFLYKLAKDTGGRYHYYNEDGILLDGPEPWESEDIRLLKQELEAGYKNLEKIAALRDECAQLAWKGDDSRYKRCSRDHLLPDRGRETAQPPMDPKDLYRLDERPNSAPDFRWNPSLSSGAPRPSTAHGYRSTDIKTRLSYSSKNIHHPSPRSRSQPNRPISAKAYQPLIAGHTRTSILRSLSSTGSYNRPLWLLPETRELFERQWERQNMIDNGHQKVKKGRKGRKVEKGTGKASSRKWLAQQGLAAKKLTLVDVLAPTFIPHKSKYIPILDKHVESKVFDDILPIGHVAGDKMNIVNPQAVNFKEYIQKIEVVIAKCKDRLDRVVWEGLPKSAKEEFESDKPVSFLDNKLKLMQALDKSGWPISEQDVILLENEIKKGESYIKQAMELENAAKKHAKKIKRQNSEDYNDATSDGDEEKDGGDDDDDDDDDASTSPKSAGKRNEEINESAGAKVSKKKKQGQTKRSKTKQQIGLVRGQKIIARSDVDGFYYPGTVISRPDSRHALINYADIGQHTVPSIFIIPVSGAIAVPPIMIGDYVLAHVINQDTGLECYVPGIVYMTPKRQQSQAKFYTVMLYTTQQAHFLRSFLVKISKIRYLFLVRYIDEINKNKDDDDDDDRSRSTSRSSASSRTSSRSRSHYQSSSSSRSRSRSSSSRSSSRSRSRSRSRSQSPYGSGHSEAGVSDLKKEKYKLKKWKKQLEGQQHENDEKQKVLHRQAKKLAKLKKHLCKDDQKSRNEHKRILKIIVDELNNIRRSRSSGSSSSRTLEWLNGQKKASSSTICDTKSPVPCDDDQQTTPFLLELRSSLPEIRDGEEVLARWSDEGWYYRGTVKENLGNCAYLVQDSTDALEKIWREDILAESDDADFILEIKDPVVALHPSYSFSYAPGVVLKVNSDQQIVVRFYDGKESELPREEVYRLSPEKFEADVAYILQKEQQWVGAPVVARNDETGKFLLGIVKERTGKGQQYVIEWSDSTTSTQNASCIFGALTKNHALNIGDRVLAMADPEKLIYLPGWITAKTKNKLSVKFCDGSFSNQVDPHQSCFWLSNEYYQDVAHFYKSKNP